MADQAPIKDLDFTYYLDVIFRRRWIVAAVALIVFGTTALVTARMRPVYQANSLLVIEKERIITTLVRNRATAAATSPPVMQLPTL